MLLHSVYPNHTVYPNHSVHTNHSVDPNHSVSPNHSVDPNHSVYPYHTVYPNHSVYPVIEGKVRQGEWSGDKLVKYTGPEMFEAQMKAKRLVKMKLTHVNSNIKSSTSRDVRDGSYNGNSSNNTNNNSTNTSQKSMKSQNQSIASRSDDVIVVPAAKHPSVATPLIKYEF